ncbi:hypothetical protein, partial [Pseudomonas putida]|uniref:hypothetical protein n=1 Tax=Pseudomonas putida TaxID=303 RepID=UPI001E2E54B5
MMVRIANVAPLIDLLSALVIGAFCLLSQLFSIGHSCLARVEPTFLGWQNLPARLRSERMKRVFQAGNTLANRPNSLTERSVNAGRIRSALIEGRADYW